MTRTALNPASIGAPVAPYSHAIKTTGSEILFLAGQVPIDKDGGTVGVGDFEAQARCVFDLLGEVLKDAGMGWDNVAKLNVFMTRREDIAVLREVRERVRRWLYGVVERGQPAGAVCHQGVIRALLSLATGWNMIAKPPHRLDWAAAHLFAAHEGDRTVDQHVDSGWVADRNRRTVVLDPLEIATLRKSMGEDQCRAPG